MNLSPPSFSFSNASGLRLRAVLVSFAALLLLLVAGCQELPTADPDGGTALSPGDPLMSSHNTPPGQDRCREHQIHATILNVAGTQAVPSILVTLANVATGEYEIRPTDDQGRVSYCVEDGGYLLHARNLSDPGPAVPLPLALAPLPDDAGLLTTAATEAENRVGVLYTPGAPFNSAPLVPSNYQAQVANPPIVVTGRPRADLELSLRFLEGESVSCSLVGSGGDLLGAGQGIDTNVFLVLPHGAGANLPPLPAAAVETGLDGYPRAILHGVTTRRTSTGGCSLSGVPAGLSLRAVLEANGTDETGRKVTFLQTLEGSRTPGQALLYPEPRRAFTGYLDEPLGDAPGTTDLGFVTYGWNATATGDVAEEFSVAARFEGLGQYRLELRWLEGGDPGSTFQVTAECNQNHGCKLLPGQSDLGPPQAQVEGLTRNDEGTSSGIVLWSVKRPHAGVTGIEVRLNAGQPGALDLAPDDGGWLRMDRDGGSGNTWVVM